MTRAVVDTNVVIRAVIKPQGSVGPVLGRLRAGDYEVILSRLLLDEVADVLGRPRIRTKYGVSPDDLETVLKLLLVRGVMVVPDRQVTVCRDPKDNHVLEAALAGRADVIVTGDDDLLVLNPFEGIPIVRPARFLALLDEASPVE